MIFNRVWAIGKDTYIRFFPNPGIGVAIHNRRYALSLWRGFEIYKYDPKHVWILKKRMFNLKLRGL